MRWKPGPFSLLAHQPTISPSHSNIPQIQINCHWISCHPSGVIIVGLQLTRTSNNLQFNFSVFSKCWVTWWMPEREYFLWKTWSQACSLLLTGEHHLGYFDHVSFSLHVIIRLLPMVMNDYYKLLLIAPPPFYWPLLTISYITCYQCLSLIITDYGYQCWFYSPLWSEYCLIFIATKYQ